MTVADPAVENVCDRVAVPLIAEPIVIVPCVMPSTTSSQDVTPTASEYPTENATGTPRTAVAGTIPLSDGAIVSTVGEADAELTTTVRDDTPLFPAASKHDIDT